MHHPIQDPETIRKAKEQEWWLTFDDVNPHAREILETYSGIAPGDVVQHVRDIRNRAIAIFVYPCIGMLKFLDIEISKTPCYDEIKQRLAAGEKYLEVGCCFAQEMRKLVIDGAPSENLYGTDLDLSFVELGYALFRDRDRLKSRFIAADILAPDSAIDALQGQISMMNAGSFFHLFSWADQLTAGKRLVGLLAKNGGSKGLITGGHVAGDMFEKKGWMDSDLYVHSEESWKKLWEEIGEATGTTWDVSVTKDTLVRTVKVHTDREYYVMRFVCRQL